MLSFDFLLFLLSAGAGIILSRQYVLNKKTELVSNFNRKDDATISNKDLILCGCMILLGIVFRFLWIDKFESLNQDEAYLMYEARTLAKYGCDIAGIKNPPIFSLWGNGEMSAFSIYIAAAFVKIFGGSRLVIRIPFLIAGLLMIYIVYRIVSILADKKAGIIATTIVSVSPWAFSISIWALDANMFPIFFLLGFYFLLKTQYKKWNIFISMIFFAIAFYTYAVSFFMIPLFLILAAVWLYRVKMVTIKDILLCILIVVTIALPLITALATKVLGITEDVDLGFMTIHSLTDCERNSDLLIYCLDSPVRFLFNLYVNILSILQVVFFENKCYYYTSTLGLGAYSIMANIFLIIGIVAIIIYVKQTKLDKENVKIRLLLFALISCLFMGIIISTVNNTRFNVFLGVEAIVLALGVAYMFKITKHKKIMKYVISIIYLGSFVTYLVMFWKANNDIYRFLAFSDYIDAVEYVDAQDYTDCNIYAYAMYSNVNEYEPILIAALDLDYMYVTGKTDKYHDQNVAYNDRFKYYISMDCLDGKLDEDVLEIESGHDYYIVPTDKVPIDNHIATDAGELSDYEVIDFGCYAVIKNNEKIAME